MVNERKNEIEIDMQKLMQAWMHKWWIILACALVCGAIVFVYTVNFITPMYTAGVTIYVNNIRSDQDIEYISNNNLLTSQLLVDTYINIIRSDTVLGKIAEESGINTTAKEIKKMMRTEQVEETELFNVYITHQDPRNAAQIANAVAEVAPSEIGNIVEGSSTKIIDYAKIPEGPASPDVRRNTFLGVLFGILIGVAYITIVFLMDVRIKDEEDLAMLFEMPVLAQIPAFSSGVKAKKKHDYESKDQKEEVAK